MGKVDLTKIKDFYEKLQGASASFWVPKVGTNLVRILPPKEDIGYFFTETYVHFIPNETPFRCLKGTEKGCPVCELVDKLRKSDNPEDLEIARRMSAKRRYLMNIIDMDDIDSGVQVYSCGREVLRQLLTYFADPDWGDLTDPDNGYDVVIEKSGTGLHTSYVVRARKKATPLEDKTVLTKLADLSKVVTTYTAEEIKNKLANLSNVNMPEDIKGNPAEASKTDLANRLKEIA